MFQALPRSEELIPPAITTQIIDVDENVYNLQRKL